MTGPIRVAGQARCPGQPVQAVRPFITGRPDPAGPRGPAWACRRAAGGASAAPDAILPASLPARPPAWLGDSETWPGDSETWLGDPPGWESPSQAPRPPCRAPLTSPSPIYSPPPRAQPVTLLHAHVRPGPAGGAAGAGPHAPPTVRVASRPHRLPAAGECYTNTHPSTHPLSHTHRCGRWWTACSSPSSRSRRPRAAPSPPSSPRSDHAMHQPSDHAMDHPSDHTMDYPSDHTVDHTIDHAIAHCFPASPRHNSSPLPPPPIRACPRSEPFSPIRACVGALPSTRLSFRPLRRRRRRCGRARRPGLAGGR